MSKTVRVSAALFCILTVFAIVGCGGAKVEPLSISKIEWERPKLNHKDPFRSMEVPLGMKMNRMEKGDTVVVVFQGQILMKAIQFTAMVMKLDAATVQNMSAEQILEKQKKDMERDSGRMGVSIEKASDFTDVSGNKVLEMKCLKKSCNTMNVVRAFVVKDRLVTLSSAMQNDDSDYFFKIVSYFFNSVSLKA